MSTQAPVQPYADFTQIDPRSVGGRAVIMLHMKNHYDKLVGTKPQLKIQAPKKYIYEEGKHVPAHRKPNKLIDPKLEVRHAFRKVAKMNKGYITTDKPTTYDMVHNLKGMKAGGDKFEMEEHQLHMKSMKKKLNKKKIPEQERRKNTQDPVAHPVRFFRRGKELPHKKVEYVAGQLAPRLVMTNQDSKLKDRFDQSGYTGIGASRTMQSVGRLSSAPGGNRPSSARVENQPFATEEVQATNAAPGRPYSAIGGRLILTRSRNC
jgi:hypothetical protein